MGRLTFATVGLALASCSAAEPVTVSRQDGSPQGPARAPAGTTIASPSRTDAIAGDDWTYTALGTEPFWSLNLHAAKGGRWSLARPGLLATNGRLDRRAAADPPHLTGRGLDASTLELTATAVPCSDGMSDRLFAHTVTVRLGSEELYGCGGAVLRPARLEGSSWTFLTLADETLSDERASLSFAGGGLRASVGCNGYEKRGAWAANDRFQGPPAIGTQMACGALDEREAALRRLLSGGVKASFSAEGLMTLEGDTVTATLRRR